MTADERLEFTKALLVNDGESEIDDAVIIAQLDCAKDAILNKLYQAYETYPDDIDVPIKWQRLQCKIAVRYILRIGAEGEDKHSENGISRSYSTTDDLDLLSPIVPYARVYK